MDTTHRERWLAARQLRGLDPATAGFGESGLLAMLGEPGVFVTILPADPLRPALDFSDEQLTAQVLPERLVGQTAYGVSFLNQITSTADALVRYYAGGEGAWRAFSAIRRDGGAEVGFDAYVTRYEQGGLANPTGSVIYRLFVLVHAVRMAIDTQARLVQLLPTLGFEADEFAPYELDVVMPGAGGGILAGFTDGWEEPGGFSNVCRCLERNPAVRLEVAHWPLDEGGQQELLEAAANRIGDAFGDRLGRHLARQGPAIGTTPSNYA